MNLKKHRVASGKAYADIHVLACPSAYQKLLTLKGYQAERIIAAQWNQTIPNFIKKWLNKIHSTFLSSLSFCHFAEEFAAIENSTKVDNPLDWKEISYKETKEEFNQNFIEQLQKDTKTIDYQGMSFLLGQMKLWNASFIIQQFHQCVMSLKLKTEWLTNMISKGFSYLYINSMRIQEIIKQKIKVSFLTLNF